MDERWFTISIVAILSTSLPAPARAHVDPLPNLPDSVASRPPCLEPSKDVLESHPEKQMCGYKSKMKWMTANSQNPQTSQATDWILVGAEDDGWVSSKSAVGMKANHKVYYTDDCCVHTDYYENSPYGDDTSERDMKWQDFESDWKFWGNGPGPIVWSYKSAQWKTW